MLLHHLSRLGKQTLVYGLSGAWVPIVGVFTLPIFARAFSPAEFGVVELGLVGFAALLLFVDFGFASSSQRSYFDYPDELPEPRRIVLATAISTSMGIAIATSALLLVARHPLSDFLFDGQDNVVVVSLVAIMLPLATLAAFTREIMRLGFQPWQYAISSALAALGAGVIGTVAVLVFDAGVEGFFLGLLAGNVLAMLFGVFVVRTELKLAFSVPELRRMLRYGLPLVPTALALWGLSFVDRVILARLTDLADVGEYAVATRFASVVVLAMSAFTLAYSPFMLSLHADDPELERRVRGKALTYVALILTTLALVLSLFARELTSVVAPAFTSAYQAVALVCFGTVAYGLSAVAVTGIAIVRQTQYAALYTGVGVALNIGLSFALIPPLGIVGAGIALVGGFALLTALYYRKSQQLHPAPFEPRKVIGLVLLGGAISVVGLADIDPLWLACSVKAASLGLFCLLLWPLGVLGRDEIAGMRAMLDRSSGLRGSEA